MVDARCFLEEKKKGVRQFSGGSGRLQEPWPDLGWASFLPDEPWVEVSLFLSWAANQLDNEEETRKDGRMGS